MISFSDITTETMSTIDPPDMAFQANVSCNFSSSWSWTNRRDEPPVDIHECLRAFSEMYVLLVCSCGIIKSFCNFCNIWFVESTWMSRIHGFALNVKRISVLRKLFQFAASRTSL